MSHDLLGIKRRLRIRPLPKHLEAVTSVGDEVAATALDLPAGAADSIWAAAESMYKTGVHPFLSLCIRRHGEILVNRSIGHADLENERIGSIETPVCAFSSSKAVTAILVHKLAEDGLINLLHPVSRYLPEFGQNGKAKITIMQLLNHRAGLPFVPDGIETEHAFSQESAFRLLCEAPATNSHGREMAYHAVTTGFIYAALVQRVTGKTISQYLNTVLRKPLGMKHFQYGINGAALENVAVNYKSGLRNPKLIENILSKVLSMPVDEIVDLSNTPEFYDSVIPSGNLYATAEEMSRFFQLLLNGGTWPGKSGSARLMDSETVQQAVREAGPMQLDAALKLPMRYSAGMMLGGAPVGMYGKDSHHAFGHLGFSNIFCWADPERDIAVGLMTTGKPVLGNHLLALPKLIHAISSTLAPCADAYHWPERDTLKAV